MNDKISEELTRDVSKAIDNSLQDIFERYEPESPESVLVGLANALLNNLVLVLVTTGHLAENKALETQIELAEVVIKKLKE